MPTTNHTTSATTLKRRDHTLAQTLWYKLTPQQAENKLGADLKLGLSHSEIRRRAEAYGPNLLPADPTDSYLNIILRQLRSPLVYILLFAAFVSLFLKHFSDLAIIFLVIVVNVAVGFFQENRASSTLAELKKVIKPRTKVLRYGITHEIDSTELVPGDIILVSAGDRVPADARLFKSASLEVSEAELTGESVPAIKTSETLAHDAPLADQHNMLFMGTAVAQGKGQGLVVDTGQNTEIGRIARMLLDTEDQSTPLQKNLEQFSRWLAGITLALSFLLLIIGLIQHRDFFEMLTTSVAVAVAIIPEGLLISLTVILALGMQHILRRRGLVRHMSAAETLGSTSIICTDKTGTLTLGEMKVTSVVAAGEEIHVQNHISELSRSQAVMEVLKSAVLVNEATITNPDHKVGDWKILGNLTDRALILSGGEVGLKQQDLEREFPRLDEISFDEKRKYAVTLRQFSAKQNVVYIKGAAEIVLSMCKYADDNGKKVPLDKKLYSRLQRKHEELTRLGLRVLAVASRKTTTALQNLHQEKEVLSGLIFLGFVGLQDPLRPEVAGALRQSQTAGLRTVIVTGDHKYTAQSIARQLGMVVGWENIIEGWQLDAIDDHDLEIQVEKIKIFARVTPAHKLRIIEAWQNRGEVVAMTGDGVNDAPALKKADIGMSLGSGTEVAKSASDLVLLDNNFQTIVSAIEQGRIIFDNIRRVIVYLLSDNFTQLILIAGALLLGLPVPLLPAQILWTNLVTDGFPNLALALEPGADDVMLKPARRKSEPLINWQMKFLIVYVGIITDFVFLGAYLLLVDNIAIDMLRTILFTSFGLNSLLYVFSLKNLQAPLWRIKLFNNRWLVFTVALGVSLQLAAVYLPPLQNFLYTVPIPLELWHWVAGLALIKVVAIELSKFLVFRPNSKLD